ncbi:hypothetical protein O71_09849 [Pontibacter sp. BAB1700]|nr:hypothetical protein O71_09849 [Pontibacter sp. BAB1700]
MVANKLQVIALQSALYSVKFPKTYTYSDIISIDSYGLSINQLQFSRQALASLLLFKLKRNSIHDYFAVLIIKMKKTVGRLPEAW